jgi:hypothetical protein
MLVYIEKLYNYIKRVFVSSVRTSNYIWTLTIYTYIKREMIDGRLTSPLYHSRILVKKIKITCQFSNYTYNNKAVIYCSKFIFSGSWFSLVLRRRTHCWAKGLIVYVSARSRWVPESFRQASMNSPFCKSTVASCGLQRHIIWRVWSQWPRRSSCNPRHEE